MDQRNEGVFEENIEEEVSSSQNEATWWNAQKKGMINDDIIWDYSTIDGLSMYEEDLELNMQRRNLDCESDQFSINDEYNGREIRDINRN